MYTENGLIVDVEEVRKVVAEADVFGVGFRLFGERLFVDTRSNRADGPFIATVEPLGSMQERMFWLGQHRPGFGMPKKFVFFFWPNSIRFFEETGIWAAIRTRVLEAGDEATAQAADRALADLYRLEHAAIVAAIKGEHHRTLWQSETSRYQQ
jgi:hypothetical protein